MDMDMGLGTQVTIVGKGIDVGGERAGRYLVQSVQSCGGER